MMSVMLAMKAALATIITIRLVERVKLVAAPALRKRDLAGPLKSEVEKCPHCNSKDITKKDGQIICTTCGKVIEKTDGDEMTVHQGEYSLPHPPIRRDGSTRAETGEDADTESNGSSNTIPDSEGHKGLNLDMPRKLQREQAAKAKGTKAENRMKEYIEQGIAIMNSITPSIPRPAKRKFRESMEKLAGEHKRISTKKILCGCIARAYMQTNVTIKEIAQECPDCNIRDLVKHRGKVRELLGETGDEEENEERYENKYKKTMVRIFQALGFEEQAERMACIAMLEVERRKSKRQGKSVETFCATIVYNILSSTEKNISQREIEKKMGLPKCAISKMRNKYDLTDVKIFEEEKSIEPVKIEVTKPETEGQKVKINPPEPQNSREAVKIDDSMSFVIKPVKIPVK